ncbi:hypothetical protein HYC85_010033 [Camellia sinensis]|uniref:Uncharacterized protein n=1 Tax=Camellia sinensis TaxID=4442 RepID=A0A7J7HHA5_CAMSI|nr:hypothetical protein HYC85_010033 [Camellia sinensis]
MRSGYGRSFFEPLLPLILGRDVSGEVAAIGASVRFLTVGLPFYPSSVIQMHLITNCNFMDLLSIIVTMQEASAISFAALSAWRALKSIARITQGSACNSEVTFCFGV